MNKGTRLIKRLVALFLVLLLSIESFAAVVGDNDGAAFITKAEFDSLKNVFQNQINQYNMSLDNKIDGAIASYLDGIRVDKKSEIDNTLYKICAGRTVNFRYTSFDSRKNRAKITIQGGLSLYKTPIGGINGWRTFIINTSAYHYDTDGENRIWYYQEKNSKKYMIGQADDYIESLCLIAGSSMTSSNGDGKLTFGRTITYNGTGTKATFGRYALSSSVDDIAQQPYETSEESGWTPQTIYYNLLKIYIGGTLTDYRAIVPAGYVNSYIYASDYDKRGTRNWEFWTTHAVSADFLPVASAITATAAIADDIPVFRFKSAYFNVNTTRSYLADTVGVDMPYYGGLPLCSAVYTGTCEFNIKVNKACYLTIKDNEVCKNTTAQNDPGVVITKGSASTGSNYIELAASTTTKLSFPSIKAHDYFIKITPKTTSDVVNITSIDEKIINQGT